MYVKEYFVNGTLPAPGTVCQPDTQPFPESSKIASRAGGFMTLEERTFAKAVGDLGRRRRYLPRLLM